MAGRIRQASRAEEALPAPSNRAALNAIERWPGTGAGSNAGAGRAERAASRLAEQSGLPPQGQSRLQGEALNEASVEACGPANAVLFEDADRAAHAEALFFRLVGTPLSKTTAWLLLTSCAPPDAWGLNTPDLLSRLRLAPVVRLAAPDTELTEAVLFKLFSDRQLQVEPPCDRLHRRENGTPLGAAREIVAALDNEALIQGRRVTRAMASDALRDLNSKNEAP